MRTLENLRSGEGERERLSKSLCTGLGAGWLLPEQQLLLLDRLLEELYGGCGRRGERLLCFSFLRLGIEMTCLVGWQKRGSGKVRTRAQVSRKLQGCLQAGKGRGSRDKSCPTGQAWDAHSPAILWSCARESDLSGSSKGARCGLRGRWKWVFGFRVCRLYLFLLVVFTLRSFLGIWFWAENGYNLY